MLTLTDQNLNDDELTVNSIINGESFTLVEVGHGRVYPADDNSYIRRNKTITIPATGAAGDMKVAISATQRTLV